ncbi:uncharacterized protein N7482_003510 [Penicillium canariense]|uniref:Uncharacterized protein n=1 Tax=Penicillium canariense TaxID=189055 RepID=A0A9W9I4U3_9EURO|nr:uncharacterized protein N7482_003510 [Penicillium canariense]KAJ5167916.1 hypothetical protein N7482_003510 [Penicillium canariense]
MHVFAAALLALSSVSVTYAAPFANPQEDMVRRKVDYQVVNVDGDPTSSAAPEIETMTETVKSVTTAPGAAPLPITITVTATPSSTPIHSSTLHSHSPPPPGASFFPPPDSDSGFFRRGLMAAGNPLQFARSYSPSTSSVFATPLAARAWYSSPAVTPSSSASVTPSLLARQFGGWSSSASLPVTPSSTASASVTPLVARNFYASSSTPSSPSSLAAWDFHSQYYPSASSSATPSSSFTLAPSANALLY